MRDVLRSSDAVGRRGRHRSRQLTIEALEDRAVPSSLAPASGRLLQALRAARSAALSRIATPPPSSAPEVRGQGVRAAQAPGEGGASRSPVGVNRPVLPRGEDPARASFIDPTVRIVGPRRIEVGEGVFIAPFANLIARGGRISIGNESDIQDNATILAGGPDADVAIGNRVIIAHNATVIGPARIGSEAGVPAFIGFNAVIDGATVEGGALVQSLARIAPGVVIRAGTSVLPGKFIRTQAEADDFSLGKVVPVTLANEEFKEAVLAVNTEFERTYVALASSSPRSLRGINIDPSDPPFNPDSGSPTLAGRARVLPRFRNRIIGDVRLADTPRVLNRVLGRMDSIRADEGTPFTFGRIARLRDQVTVHALEFTSITVGEDLRVGEHAVIHGGADDGNSPIEVTRLGNSITVGDNAVVFRSTVGDGSVIGDFAYVDGSQLAPGTVVPRGTVIVNNEVVGTVEWV